MVYQGQCRDKLAVLCKMTFKRRSEIARAKPGFEILAPFIKNVLGVFVETKVRNRREFIGCRAGSARRQAFADLTVHTGRRRFCRHLMRMGAVEGQKDRSARRPSRTGIL